MITIRTRDYSKSATFALAIWRSNGGLPLPVEQNPNAVAPNPANVIKVTAKRGGILLIGAPLIRYFVVGGTTNITIQAWYYDDGLGLWVRFTNQISSMVDNNTGANTATTGTGAVPGSKWYPQVIVNNSATGVQKLGYDIV